MTTTTLFVQQLGGKFTTGADAVLDTGADLATHQIQIDRGDVSDGFTRPGDPLKRQKLADFFGGDIMCIYIHIHMYSYIYICV